MNVKVGYNVLKELEEYLRTNNVDKLYIITDSNVHKLYMDYLNNIIEDWDYNIFIMVWRRKKIWILFFNL